MYTSDHMLSYHFPVIQFHKILSWFICISTSLHVWLGEAILYADTIKNNYTSIWIKHFELMGKMFGQEYILFTCFSFCNKASLCCNILWCFLFLGRKRGGLSQLILFILTSQNWHNQKMGRFLTVSHSKMRFLSIKLKGKYWKKSIYCL